jgi:hypothetical protein
MDLESFFRERLDSMLVTASWVEGLENVLGVSGVSQIWSDRPSWYLWLDGAQGAYNLEIDETVCEYVGSQECRHAVFSVRCYPFPTERVFGDFSFEERALVLSRFFDKTNTPAFEYREKIDRACFTVASVTFSTDAEDRWSVFTLEGLDASRYRYEVETVAQFELLEAERSFAGGEVDRRVPAWLLGHKLFDCLVSLYAYHTRRRPLRVLLTDSPGWEVVVNDRGSAGLAEVGDVHLLSQAVLFSDESDEAYGQTASLIPSRLSHRAHEIMYDLIFPGDNAHHCGHQEGTPAFLSGLWWSINHFPRKSHCASLCGCH